MLLPILASASRTLLPLLVVALITGCASPARRAPDGTPVRAEESKIQRLTADLRALGANVDPHEARAFADIALNYSLDLAERYHVVRPASLHNVLVNLKFKERGLCFEWAEDLQARLSQLGSLTLKMRRVGSKINTPHEHNAVLVIVPNQAPEEGIILDAWRHGGDLYWSKLKADKRHPWKVRTDLPWLKDSP